MSVDFPTFGRPKSVTNPLFCFFIIFSFFIACQSPAETPKTFGDFNKAESFYRQGLYENSLDYYEKFISANPESPLTKIAKLRVRTIHREVASMLENPNIKNARYHGRKRAETERALQYLIESQEEK